MRVEHVPQALNPEMFEYERYLLENLERLDREYRQQAEPYIKALTKLRSIYPDKVYLILEPGDALPNQS